jgi:hypothetical protein
MIDLSARPVAALRANLPADVIIDRGEPRTAMFA